MIRLRGLKRVISQGDGHEPDHLESGVADIQPGELIRGGIGVADDVGASERQDGAGDRLRQRGQHDPCDQKSSRHRLVAAW